MKLVEILSLHEYKQNVDIRFVFHAYTYCDVYGGTRH
jgi:hypothetical protein